jgi:XTP/dITP diphosphohydrolase
MNIWFASGNKNKKLELCSLLNREIKTPAEAGLEFDPEETGSSYIENSLLKAEALYRLLEKYRPSGYKSGDPIIADDSGLNVDALGGRPGVHSAYYGGKGLGAAEKNALLLAELGDNPQRSARFVCAMVLYFGPDRFFVAQETIEGKLVKNVGEARGSSGFGYDPILYIPELGRTVAELSDEEKNRISHRGKAGKLIAQILAGL